MKAAALWCAVLLVSCQRQKPDPRVFEVKTPAHVTVRNIDAPKPLDCSTAANWREEFSCRVAPSPRIGCSYVEVGNDADAPIIRRTPPSTPECASLGGARSMLLKTPASSASLEFDTLGSRAVLRVDSTQWVLFLHRGQLVERQSTAPRGPSSALKRGVDGGVLWNTVDPLLSVAPSFPDTFTEEDVQKLFDETTDAQRVLDVGIVDAFSKRRLTPDSPDWERFEKRLDDAGRSRLRDVMLDRVAMGEASVLPTLENDATVPRDSLLAAISAGITDNGEDAHALFDALFRLDPLRASSVACNQLENSVLGDESTVGAEGYGTVLALIAKYKVKCPWVLAVLEQTPCDAALRRDSLENEDDTNGNLPLATAAERALALKLKFTPVAELKEAEEDFVTDDHSAWLLLAAADVQGPLPESFVKRNARRLYRRVDRFGGPFYENPCLRTSTPPAEWACRMPLWLTTAEREGCRLDVDDAARTLTFTGQPGYARKQLGAE